VRVATFKNLFFWNRKASEQSAKLNPTNSNCKAQHGMMQTANRKPQTTSQTANHKPHITNHKPHTRHKPKTRDKKRDKQNTAERKPQVKQQAVSASSRQ
jgi:hypothetical protein